MNKEDVILYFNLSKNQVEKIEFFISQIINYNKHTNLVGKSTIENIWERHVLDCLQLSKHINEKKLKIFDIGTGAGLPGVLLSIIGYKNVLMVDSVKKKTDFIKGVVKELTLSARVQNKRIEKVKRVKQDIIVSRALAPLSKLLTYALLHSEKNTTLLFLKGRSVNNEIEIAMKNFDFDFKKFESVSSGDGCILQINNFIKK
ncbi:MAG: 16S rRNA (guanine(527)-N(7))-methyltransferase RsmG [Pelagibacteraceae bacterium]|nr:16S rRNA (guanine(527)-N(7))-methyltransferase RsmG [Pelagibacteraceae bacterium]MBT4645923.1 16S rRNA (guanine(527)-N(7))-methyltransferase RsmG [Pelagibacteraceae bacterium]MBT6198504.1 16S rRNA (guanine(527)-N(7))-methyltransferase RsmG [Pelagibacteraceae bacterium]